MLVLKARQQRIDEIVFSPDGRGLLAAGQFSALYWSAIEPNRPPLSLGDGNAWGVGFAADGAYLVVSTGAEGVWTQPVSGQEGVKLEAPEAGREIACWWRRPVVIHDHHGMLSGWRISADGKWEKAWSRQQAGRGRPFFTPDGRKVCLVSSSYFSESSIVARYSIACRDPETGKFLESLPMETYSAHPPSLSPDHRYLVSYLAEELTVEEPRAAKRITRRIKSGSRHRFTSIAFHPSGRLLAATCNDATVKLYDTATWDVAKTYTWNVGKLRSVAFSPDGTLAAAGSDTGRVVVWDVDL